MLLKAQRTYNNTVLPAPAKEKSARSFDLQISATDVGH